MNLPSLLIRNHTFCPIITVRQSFSFSVGRCFHMFPFLKMRKTSLSTTDSLFGWFSIETVVLLVFFPFLR